ncbi:MAG: acyl-CoA thioesterase [Candidatus Azobacteroides sp.]|nr:acyl-CoA thioesterase [Candidatus Azobacteroides sp.]
MEQEKDNYQFNHQMSVQIRFSDIDLLGHVNNAVYMNYFNMAKTKYFEAVNADAVDWSRLDVVVANVNVNFLKPVFFSDSILVKTKVTRLGNKSFDMIQQIELADTGEIKTICRSVMVGFDIPTNSAKKITDSWKEKIRKFEGEEL